MPPLDRSLRSFWKRRPSSVPGMNKQPSAREGRREAASSPIQLNKRRVPAAAHRNEVPIRATCRLLLRRSWRTGCSRAPSCWGWHLRGPFRVFSGDDMGHCNLKVVVAASRDQQDSPTQNCSWAMVYGIGGESGPCLCLILQASCPFHELSMSLLKPQLAQLSLAQRVGRVGKYLAAIKLLLSACSAKVPSAPCSLGLFPGFFTSGSSQQIADPGTQPRDKWPDLLVRLG